MRYFIHLAYEGTNYHGWQKQVNGVSVQEKLNFSVSCILNEHIVTMGCGRTDAGVHATDFYAHFDTDKELDEKFTFRLNSVLPKDIRVFKVFLVTQNAHARFHAKSRTYEYFIHQHENGFIRNFSTKIHNREMDWDLVIEATKLIPTFKDFTSLCRASEDFSTNLCNVTEARWDKIIRPAVAGAGTDEFMRFTITSNRFLRGMVRKIVGALILIGRHRLTIEDFQKTVEAKEQFKFALTSPPQGLYLTKVRYPNID